MTTSIPTCNADNLDAVSKFSAWVRSLEHHPLAEIVPLVKGEEFTMLVEDIRKNGIRVPIMLYQGRILDGRNRHRAGLAADYKFKESDFTRLALGIDPEGFVISTNLQRRQLSTKEKRAVIAKLIEGKPGLSDRQIANLAGVDPKTVASVKTELENRALEFIARLDALTASQWQKVISERRDKVMSMLHGHVASELDVGSPCASA